MANLWCEQCGQRVGDGKIAFAADFPVFEGSLLVRALRSCVRCGTRTWHVRDTAKDKAHARDVRQAVTFVVDSPIDGGLLNE